jgi:hypothetical protein
MNIFFSWKSCVILFLSGMGERGGARQKYLPLLKAGTGLAF